MVGGDQTNGLLVRFLRCLDELTDVAVVVQELQLDRQHRGLFVHNEQVDGSPPPYPLTSRNATLNLQVVLDARGEPTSMPASAIVSGPYICGFPALAMWMKGTALPFGAVMEFAVNQNGVVHTPPLCLGPRPRPGCHPRSPGHPRAIYAGKQAAATNPP